METGDKPVKYLGMAAGKEGNHTHGADDINQWISHIDCLGLWQFVNNSLRISNCCHSIVLTQTGHPVKP